jgi:hypothetical protein
VDVAVHQNEVTPDAAQSLHGLARLRFAGSTAVRDGQTRMLIHLHAVTMLGAVGVAGLLEARRVLEPQPSGTLVLRPHGVVCQALKDTGTIAPFALSNGPGM